MMQRLMSLPLALRVLVIALALGAVVILAMGIPALISSTSERVSAFVQGVESQPADTRELTMDAGEVTDDSGESTVSPETEEYLSKVKETNIGAVEAFLKIDEKLRKFDSLTPEDVEDMEAKRKEVAENLDQIAQLDPPPEYQEQYELYYSAIVDLDEAAALAYSMASEPDSITPAMPERYDLLLDRADFRLQQSDAILESGPETTSQESD